jgi:tol-pal system protein YbgF
MNNTRFKLVWCSLVSLSTAVHAAETVPMAPVEMVVAKSSPAARIARLERVLEAKNQVIFDMQQAIDELRQEVLQLRGGVEQQHHQLSQVLERQRSLYQKIHDISNQNKGNAQTEPAPTPLETESQAMSDSQMYEQATNLVLVEKDYQAATAAFEAFLQQHPTSSLVPNAYYWLGQLQYSRHDNENAFASFQRVVKQYPSSNKRGESLMKIGLILQKKQEWQQAQASYEKVLSEYPNTSIAHLATLQMQQLQAEKSMKKS